ncbi:AAA family ATPase [Pararoseomonas sp. SCSIO 73927]|uniref:AAA family ATPase n=1 Tax=Pararoseomonas sp. SCSIO 73927 TaxID=3114537 RepID=UPI0030D4B82A
MAEGAVEPWGQVGPEVDPLRRSLEHEPATLCALLMLRDALLQAPDFLTGAMQPGTVSIIQVPDVLWGRNVARALDLVVEALDTPPKSDSRAPALGTSGISRQDARSSASSPSRDLRGPDQFQIFDLPVRPAHNVEVFRDAVGRGTAIHVLSHAPDTLLSPDILLAEDARLVVEPPGSGVLALLAAALETGATVPLCCLPDVTGSSPDGTDVSPILVNLAHRRGQDAATFLGRLCTLVDRSKARLAAAKQESTLTLDDLPGQGEATAWGRQLVTDLTAFARGELDWSDVDRGVILEGPPGCGKSSFARALAGSAGVPLVSASLAQWQGAREGHLGHLLSAMKATFDEARRKAPAIILIDEVDSFPSRASVTHKHRDYVVEVINGLLEQLDGAVKRDGVVVIATCNDASNLDPAMTRAGRLERIIRLDRPDAPALQQILRVHLHGALQTEDLLPVARTAALRQAVGADIERWCRGARRRARAAGRLMVVDDLIQEVGPAPSVHHPDAVRRMAAHEAGHALGFASLGVCLVEQVVVEPTVGGLSSTTVDIAELVRGMPYATRRDVGEQLRAILAGRAAEEVLLGAPSGGAGGSQGSDLARATQLACAIVVSSGLDDHPEALLFLAPADDPVRLGHLLLVPEIRHRVSAVISQGYAEALDLVRKHRDAVERVAAALVEMGHLSGQEVEAMLSLRAPASDVVDGLS